MSTESYIKDITSWISENTAFYQAHEFDPDQPCTITHLASGEYHINLLVTCGTSRIVLRINTKSQMGLARQIAYEYHALLQLSSTGRTPRPYHLYETENSDAPCSCLTMEYLPGKALDYRKHLFHAAQILADIHGNTLNPLTDASSCAPDFPALIRPERPLHAMVHECKTLLNTYLMWPSHHPYVARLLIDLVARADRCASESESARHKGLAYTPCIINTELNSGNFLIDEPNTRPTQGYLIDWEKPLIGDPAQDLGHFLAPTTTLWRTDVTLTPSEQERMINHYIACHRSPEVLGDIIERTRSYINMNCVRGVTWCAHATVEYAQPNRALTHELTRSKIRSYLTPDFLEEIRDNW